MTDSELNAIRERWIAARRHSRVSNRMDEYAVAVLHAKEDTDALLAEIDRLRPKAEAWDAWQQSMTEAWEPLSKPFDADPDRETLLGRLARQEHEQLQADHPNAEIRTATIREINAEKGWGEASNRETLARMECEHPCGLFGPWPPSKDNPPHCPRCGEVPAEVLARMEAPIQRFVPRELMEAMDRKRTLAPFPDPPAVSPPIPIPCTVCGLTPEKGHCSCTSCTAHYDPLAPKPSGE